MIEDKYPKLLLVDDQECHIYLLESLLASTNYQYTSVNNGKDAIDIVRSRPKEFDLILLDINMPEMDGLEVAKIIKTDEATKHIAVIFLTADKRENEDVAEGLSVGADDYITKPFNSVELLARVNAVLRTKRLQDDLAELNATLDQKVRERTEEIERTQDVAIFGLAKLAESRDPETGQHLERIRIYTKALAENLLKSDKFKSIINDKFIEMIYKSSPLHDIGKVGIPDKVLLKPGKLTDEEFEIMKKHTLIGGTAIAAAEKDLKDQHTFLRMGKIIAFFHHEKFDGTGYPHGLKGEAIPLEARIMAIADVFDAMVSRRVYKDPEPFDDVWKIIIEESGKHFDPNIVRSFCELGDFFQKTQKKFGDVEGTNHAHPPDLARPT